MTDKKKNVEIVPVQDEHLSAVARIQTTFLNSKHMCCCIPLGIFGKEAIYRYKFEKHPEIKDVAAVAVADGKVIGFIQLILHGMPCDMHSSAEGEAYVETIAVDAAARGMGAGTKLMKWAESTAIQKDCSIITLDVIKGNPAIGLYERIGYEIQESSCCHCASAMAMACCLTGPVICPVGGSSYFSGFNTHFMKKALVADK